MELGLAINGASGQQKARLEQVLAAEVKLRWEIAPRKSWDSQDEMKKKKKKTFHLISPTTRKFLSCHDSSLNSTSANSTYP